MSDHTGYRASHSTNRTASFALTKLKSTAIFFVFGHGGSALKSAQTFWDGTHWSYMVQGDAARQDLIAQGLWDAQTCVWLNDPAIANDAFKKVLLSVFLGCNTAYQNNTWGSPADGVVAKQASCALGWTTTIFTHDLDVNGNVTAPGAEEYSDMLWQLLCTQNKALEDAAIQAVNTPYGRVPAGKNLGNYRIVSKQGVDGPNLKLAPARFGN